MHRSSHSRHGNCLYGPLGFPDMVAVSRSRLSMSREVPGSRNEAEHVPKSERVSTVQSRCHLMAQHVTKLEN